MSTDAESNPFIGELLDTAAAERRAERIRRRLDAIVDNYRAVLPMIREAIEKRDDVALGYRSVGEYVADRFGGALGNLGIEVRREVVRELTDAGMSTRAIGKPLGVSVGTVHADQVFNSEHLPQTPASAGDAGAAQPTPTPKVAPAEVVDEGPADHVGTDDVTATTPGPETPAATRAPVVGIDGKRYPARKSSDRRRPLADTARDLGLDIHKLSDRVERLRADDRFDRNKNEVAAHLRHHLAHAVEVLTDLEEQINSLTGA